MITLTNIKIPASSGSEVSIDTVAKLLGIPRGDVISVRILKRSIDARKKSDVSFIFTLLAEVKNEAAVLLANPKTAAPYLAKEGYIPRKLSTDAQGRVFVIGAGPAGLFAALTLAEAGVPCTLLEQGQPVESRSRDVERFWATGDLCTTSNVQFGEGGAGTFSDGKLTTGTSDVRIPYVFDQFVRFGAPEDILYLKKPHIGTDMLRDVVRNMRKHLLSLGCEIMFGAQMTDIDISDGALRAIEVACGGSTVRHDADFVILAPGNSARDTFMLLHRRGVPMSAKPFSVGVRIEHRQKDIDTAQYGQAATLGTLPAADYKLAVHLGSGRSVYTFCVCPGGSVVAAASEHGGVVTNGMSEYARAGENANGGLLVSVSPDDFGGDPMQGIEYQRRLERAAFEHGGGAYHAPAQLVGDFLKRRASTSAGKVKPTYMPGVTYCNLWDVLPEYICRALEDALPQMEQRIRGFSAPDAVLTAVETRSSCPLRIEREDYRSVGVRGLYPCGEGAGYAGGITSAAVDGIRCAEAVMEQIESK